MSNNKKALKSGVWYTLSNFLIRSIGFITTPIFTRLLTKSEYGSFNNYSSWLSIITIFVTLNLESTLISARYDYEEKFDEYIFSMIGLCTTSVMVWFLIANVFSSQMEKWLGLKISYINSMLIYLLFLPAVNFFQARERYYFEYKKTVITSIILSVGTAIISVLLVTQIPNKLTGRILGSIIMTIIMGAIFMVFFLIKGKRIKLSYWKYALPICLPYIPHLLSMTVLNSTDRVMIDKMCGPESTALYSLAYNCGAMVTLLLTSLNSAFAPWLGEKLAENNTEEIRAVSKKYIVIFFLFAIMIMFISPEILWILGGDAYMEAKYVMAPVSMGCICQFLYTLFVNVEQFKKKTVGMAIASGIAAVLNLGLNFLLIPRFGYLAAAYTTLAGYICLLIIHMYLVGRLKMTNIYSYKFVAGVTIIGAISMGLIILLYSNNVARYIAIGCYCIITISIICSKKSLLINYIKK